jgi:hypothetical protein
MSDSVRLDGWHFSQIPNAVVRDDRISAMAFRTFCAIACYANTDKRAWPGIQRLVQKEG